MPTTYGYTLSSEEHRPNDLVRYARQAEELGFSFVSLSDHYHPWIDRQAAELVTEELVADQVVCGPDPERYVKKLREYEEAGAANSGARLQRGRDAREERVRGPDGTSQ